MATINAGALDRVIVLQTASITQDPNSGEEVIDWDNADLTLWAQWLPAGTREAWQAQQRLQSYVDGVYRIYYIDPAPSADDNRIIGHDGRTYDLKPPIEIGRGEGWDIPVVARGEG